MAYGTKLYVLTSPWSVKNGKRQPKLPQGTVNTTCRIETKRLLGRWGKWQPRSPGGPPHRHELNIYLCVQLQAQELRDSDKQSERF